MLQKKAIKDEDEDNFSFFLFAPITETCIWQITEFFFGIS